MTFVPIAEGIPIAQAVAPPVTNGNGNGEAHSSEPPAITPNRHARRAERKTRYSKARYDNAIADLVVAPRSTDLVLDEIQRQHPVGRFPRDLRRRAQIAALCRRLTALGADTREVLDWMARFASPARI
jgi:hypothetical protein